MIMKQQKLQRLEPRQFALLSTPPSPIIPTHTYVLSGSSPPMPSISSTPIFLSPSNFDPFTPSPSPLPAVFAASDHQSSLPKAAIIGGSVAGVVTLAIAATVISSVAGKVGIGCVFGPIINLFWSLAGNFTGPCSKLKSLCEKFRCWNPSKGTSNKAPSDDEAGGDNQYLDLNEILGQDLDILVSKVKSGTATAHPSPLRDGMKSHANQLGTSAQDFLAFTVSDFAESELKKQKEMILKPVNKSIAEAQGYGQCLLSATNKVSDDLKAFRQSADAHLSAASKLKAEADHMRSSTAAMAGTLMKQTAADATSIFNEAIGSGAEKMKNAIADEYAGEMKRLLKLEHEPIMIDEEVLLHRLLAKTTAASAVCGTNGEDDEEAEGKKHILGDAGPVCIVETVSDTYMDASQEEIMSAVKDRDSYKNSSAVAHEDERDGDGAQQYTRSPSGTSNNNMALIPTGGGNNKQGGSIVPVPTKAKALVPARTVTAAGQQMLARDDVEAQGKGKASMGKGKAGKRPTNLGHVSFSCEMSAHRLRFFTSCRSGGTYGSPPPSYPPANHTYTNSNRNHYNNYNYSHNNDYINYNPRNNENFYISNDPPYPMYTGNHGLLTNTSDPAIATRGNLSNVFQEHHGLLTNSSGPPIATRGNLSNVVQEHHGLLTNTSGPAIATRGNLSNVVQEHQPSQSILPFKSVAPAPTQHTIRLPAPFQVIHTSSSDSPLQDCTYLPTPSTHDYGCPFDGVL